MTNFDARICDIKRHVSYVVETPEDLIEVISILAQTPMDEWHRLREKHTYSNSNWHCKKAVPLKMICQVCGSTHETDRGYHDDVCTTCYDKYILQVRRIDLHRTRARKANLLDTLRTSEWVRTLQYFNNMCAYCQDKPYEFFEHFLPIELGGSTTRWNCVPSCRSCNRKKGNYHPSDIKTIPQSDIQRVQAYLDTLKP